MTRSYLNENKPKKGDYYLQLPIHIMSTDIAMAPAAGPSITPAVTTSTPTTNPAPTINKDSRIHTHSHIKGLGLSPEGRALPIGQGFVGQAQAREALGLHLGLLRSGKYSGRPLLLVGPPGTGKVSGDGLRGDVLRENKRGMLIRLRVFFGVLSLSALYLRLSVTPCSYAYLALPLPLRSFFPLELDGASTIYKPLRLVLLNLHRLGPTW